MPLSTHQQWVLDKAYSTVHFHFSAVIFSASHNRIMTNFEKCWDCVKSPVTKEGNGKFAVHKLLMQTKHRPGHYLYLLSNS